MPRSGTTLCEQILAAHAQAHGAGERRRSPASCDAWAARLAATAGAAGSPRSEPDALDEAAQDYLAELHALAPGQDADRRQDAGQLSAISAWSACMLPGAKIIHCVRDPRDIGLSIFTFRFHGAARLCARPGRSRLDYRPARHG